MAVGICGDELNLDLCLGHHGLVADGLKYGGIRRGFGNDFDSNGFAIELLAVTDDEGQEDDAADTDTDTSVDTDTNVDADADGDADADADADGEANAQ